MNWIPIAQGVVAKIDDYLKHRAEAKKNSKLRTQLRNNRKDFEDVVQKAQGIATLNIQGLNDLRGFVMEKQANLARRELIPQDIRAEGSRVYSLALQQIHQRLHP